MLQSNETIFHDKINVFKDKNSVINISITVRNESLKLAVVESNRYFCEINKMIKVKFTDIDDGNSRVQIWTEGDLFRLELFAQFNIKILSLESYSYLIDDIQQYILNNKNLKKINIEFGKTEFV